MLMKKQQLEITLPASQAVPRCRPHVRRRRPASARWWFDQMRRAVDQAMDWSPAPSARAEQAHLPLAASR